MRGRGASTEGRVAPSDRSAHAAEPPVADRRRERSSRTRTQILDALIALVESGNPKPSSRQIAERAGVARRSVFHHFEDVNLLYLGAVELQLARHRSLVVPVAPRGPLTVRIRLLCRQRRNLYEMVGPVLRAATTRIADASGLDSLLAEELRLLRDQLAAALAPELAQRGVGAELVLDTLAMVTGWEQWQALRFSARRTPASAEDRMADAVARILR